MKKQWISFLKQTPDPGINPRVLIFTPTEDVTLRYRIISTKLIKTASDATHWQYCEDPDV